MAKLKHIVVAGTLMAAAGAWVSQAQAVTCEAVAPAKCYYVSNQPGSGTGTFTNPWGMADMGNPNAAYCADRGVFMTALHPGDYLYFRGGTYSYVTCTDPMYYFEAYIQFPPGTASQPITVKPYPGETVSLEVASGVEPTIGLQDYNRLFGFYIKDEVIVYGQSPELAYCDLHGNTITTNDNNQVLRLDSSFNAWVHHNNIHDTKTTTNFHNSSCIKPFNQNLDSLIEDNYIHDCTVGDHEKYGPLSTTFRRNYWVRNDISNYRGSDYTNGSYTVKMYDNVFVTFGVDLQGDSTGAEVHDNLFLNVPTMTGAEFGASAALYWNNVSVSPVSPYQAYEDGYDSSVGAAWSYFDYNVYEVSPTYLIGFYTVNQNYTLSTIRTLGFETHASVTSASNIYVDQVHYQLKAPWTTAGRFGDPVGPDNVAQILDITRYGPPAYGVTPPPPPDATPPAAPKGLSVL